MPENTRYVSCKVSLGLFETEFYVIVFDSSAYVDRRNVKIGALPSNGGEVQGSVLAYLITESSDKALVELPGEPVVGGLRTWVPKSSLSEVGAGS